MAEVHIDRQACWESRPVGVRVGRLCRNFANCSCRTEWPGQRRLAACGRRIASGPFTKMVCPSARKPPPPIISDPCIGRSRLRSRHCGCSCQHFWGDSYQRRKLGTARDIRQSASQVFQHAESSASRSNSPPELKILKRWAPIDESAEGFKLRRGAPRQVPGCRYNSSFPCVHMAPNASSSRSFAGHCRSQMAPLWLEHTRECPSS